MMVPNLLEMELQSVESCRVGTGNLVWVFCKSRK